MHCDILADNKNVIKAISTYNFHQSPMHKARKSIKSSKNFHLLTKFQFHILIKSEFRCQIETGLLELCSNMILTDPYLLKSLVGKLNVFAFRVGEKQLF